MTPSFGSRLAAQFDAGRHLCVGIDPHASILEMWGLEDSAAGAERLGREVVLAAAGHAACVKPQVSFFERFGSAGYAALERVLADARSAGVMVIADAKRGDIGSTLDAYADAWLAPDAPLEVDALTVTGYLGFDTLRGALHHVAQHGKGLFVLAATSNPEAKALQTAVRADGRSVSAAMIDDARAANLSQAGDTAAKVDSESVGSVGVVLGATLRLSDFSIDISAPAEGPRLPVLAPGFGHQGARIEEAREIFGNYSHAILANESRSLLAGGLDGLEARIAERAATISRALGREADSNQTAGGERS